MSDFHLGPCNVYRADGITNVNIGPTEGGVSIGINMDVGDILTDQDGSQPLEQVIIGMGATITIPMTALTFSKFQFAIPGSEYVEGGGEKKLHVANPVGLNLTDQSTPILIKRLNNGIETTAAFTGNVPNWITGLKCAPQDLGDILYSKDTQQIFEVVFRCYPDDTQLTPLGKKGVLVFGNPPAGWES